MLTLLFSIFPDEPVLSAIFYDFPSLFVFHLCISLRQNL